MEAILNMSVDEMPGLKFNCGCGQEHELDVKKIVLGQDVLGKISDLAGNFKNGSIFLMADNNTYGVCGSKVKGILDKDGFRVKEYVFNTTHPLVPDEKALGLLLLEIGTDASLIVSVGSGSLNDLAKMMSFKLKIPYIIIATAPSMDGYVSNSSALIVDGYKRSLNSISPYAIIADINILKEAPMTMLHAGFGDILGKYTALADWELARRVIGEHYCEVCVSLVKNALKKCLKNARGIISRSPEAIRYMMEALLLSGVAMKLVNITRPASGSEHHLSHYWEIDALSRGVEHPLHGNSVGTGTVIISTLYEISGVKEKFKLDIPKSEDIMDILKSVGAAETPKALGISRNLFYKSILHAKEVRPRYTILQYLSSQEGLEKYAEELTRRYYD